MKLAFPEISGKNRFHLQKVRVDALLGNLPPHLVRKNKVPLKFHRFLLREDVWGLVDQQNSRLVGKCSPPRFFLLDSYSELTDQKFLVKNSSSFFFANYSDVSPEALMSGQVKSVGLLNLDDLAPHFENLIATICNQWGPIPIILMAYPPDLETRELFLTRSAAIEEVFDWLSSRYLNVSVVRPPSIEIRPDLTEAAENRVFPYHYSGAVKEQLAKNLREICRVKET